MKDRHLWRLWKTEHQARLSFALTQHSPSYAFSPNTRTRRADSRGERGSASSLNTPLAAELELEIFFKSHIYGRKKKIYQGNIYQAREGMQRWPVDWKGPVLQIGEGQGGIPVSYYFMLALF